MPLRKLVRLQSLVALCLFVFSPVALKAQNESASALAQQITDALKTKKPDWKYIVAIESTRFPMVPSEKRVIVGDWSSPDSPAQVVLVSVYSVDSSGEATKWLRPVRDKGVAAGWTVARFLIGDEGYLSKYKNGERFEIEFRKGTTVAKISGDDLNIVKEFAQCIVEQIPASRGLQMSISHDDAAQGSDKALQFTMVFHNIASQEIIITPGTTYNCGHEGSKTDLVKMNLTEASGMPHRRLEFLGSGPPYQAGCFGRVDLFEVAVKPGESITLPLDLTKYLDLSNSKQYDQAHFHAGTYSLQMELTGPPIQFVDGRPTPRGVWVGTVTSNVLQVHFDKEFAALVSDLPK